MNTITTISDLAGYLDTLLDFNRFASIDTINGVQVSKSNAPIRKIAYAVDSSLSIINCAARQNADALLVHHGIYWGQGLPLVDAMYYKAKALLDGDIALVAVHLPLDAHVEFGNNARLAKRLELDAIQPFGEYQGVAIGAQGSYASAKPLDEVLELLFRDDGYGNTSMPMVSVAAEVSNTEAPNTNTDGGNTRTLSPPQALGICRANTAKIRKVAIISGGGTKEIDAAYEAGADLYITGDASHTAWLRARELGINAVFAGHYFTEVWGVLALAEHLFRIFTIEGVFIDEPTEL